MIASSPKNILYTTGFMLLFWSVYDGIISYLTPIIMSSRGLSNTEIGMLISFSAISGAVLDIFISKVLRVGHYLRYFIFVFIIGLSYPFFLWSSQSFAAFLLIMAAWGLTYDFINFGIYDLSARISPKSQHTHNITIIGGFKALGYLIGPLLIAYLVSIWTLSFTTLSVTYLFLAISVSLYAVLFSISSMKDLFRPLPQLTKPIHWTSEVRLWSQFSRLLSPVLIFNTMFYIYESVFWTLGPIFSQQFPEFKNFSVLFMMVYALPSIFVIKYAQKITDLFGKKRTAYISLILAALFLLPFSFTNEPRLLLILVFLSTMFATLSISAIGGAFVDYVSESTLHDNEIIGLRDFSQNIGYIIGPTLAGVLSDNLGIRTTFSLVSLGCILVVSSLFFITPKHIRVT